MLVSRLSGVIASAAVSVSPGAETTNHTQNAEHIKPGICVSRRGGGFGVGNVTAVARVAQSSHGEGEEGGKGEPRKKKRS